MKHRRQLCTVLCALNSRYTSSQRVAFMTHCELARLPFTVYAAVHTSYDTSTMVLHYLNANGSLVVLHWRDLLTSSKYMLRFDDLMSFTPWLRTPLTLLDKCFCKFGKLREAILK